MRISQLILKLYLLIIGISKCSSSISQKSEVQTELRRIGWTPSKTNCLKLEPSHKDFIILTGAVIKGVKTLITLTSLVLVNSISYYVTLTTITAAASLPCILVATPTTPRPRPVVTVGATRPPSTTPFTLPSTTPIPLPSTTPSLIVYTCPPCFCGRSMDQVKDVSLAGRDNSTLQNFDPYPEESLVVKILSSKSCLERFLCEVKQRMGKFQDKSSRSKFTRLLQRLD